MCHVSGKVDGSPVIERPTRYVRPRMDRSLSRMALMRCSVPGTPARLSARNRRSASVVALPARGSALIANQTCMQTVEHAQHNTLVAHLGEHEQRAS